MERDATAVALQQVIEPFLHAEGMALVDLHWGHRGKRWVLTLFIEGEEGVTLDDCERISDLVGQLVDVENLIGHAYTLEVSSPGLDRPLRPLADYERFRGRLVKITTTAPIRGRYTVAGRLVGVEAHTVLVEVAPEGIVHIPFEQIKHARLEVEF